MDNDRTFTFFAVTLITSLAAVVAWSVMLGWAAIPTLGVFVSHWALSLGFRASYKSLDANYEPFPFLPTPVVEAPVPAPTELAAEEADEKLAA